jgi:hypothetical protein
VAIQDRHSETLQRLNGTSRQTVYPLLFPYKALEGIYCGKSESRSLHVLSMMCKLAAPNTWNKTQLQFRQYLKSNFTMQRVFTESHQTYTTKIRTNESF